MLQAKIINFCLTFPLTGVHFQGELNYVGHMDWQKIRSGTIKTRKSLISVVSFNYMLTV